MRHALLLLTALPLLLSSAPAVGGKVFLKKDEALSLAFLDHEVERVTSYLTKEEKKRATKLAKFDPEQGVVMEFLSNRIGFVDERERCH